MSLAPGTTIAKNDCGQQAYVYAAAGLGIGILIGALGTIGLYLGGKFL